MSVALALLAAHLIADFPLQTDTIAANKLTDSRIRLTHSAVHFFAVGLFLLPITTPTRAIQAAFGVFFMHYLIDTRRWAEPKENAEWYPMAVDQTMHVASLYLVSVIVL